MKQCIVCHAVKDIDEFYRNPHCTTDGHEGRCKECRKALQRSYRESDPDGHRQRGREYERAHRDGAKRRMADWMAKNADRKRHYDSEYRKRDPARTKNQRKVDNGRRRARVVGAEGSYTAREWETLKARYGNRCLACGRGEPDVKITPDHVVPLALGGSNAIENIQPLCWGCNAAKQARTVDYRP